MKYGNALLFAILIYISTTSFFFGQQESKLSERYANKNEQLKSPARSLNESEQVIEIGDNLKGIAIVTEFIENFVVNSDEDFSNLIDAQIREHSFYFSEKIVHSFPLLGKKLNQFFLKERGCDWFYVFKKEMPYEGFFFFRKIQRNEENNKNLWEVKFSSYSFLEEQWFRILIEENLLARNGYVWDKEANVLVRPKQTVNNYTGKCIYCFGFSKPPSTIQEPFVIILGEIPNK